MTNVKIEHDEKRQLFYFEEAGERGELRYDLREKVMDLTHTGVPVEMQGRGFGTELVVAALNYARENGLKIIPSCPFVEAHLGKDQSARELVANGL